MRLVTLFLSLPLAGPAAAETAFTALIATADASHPRHSEGDLIVRSDGTLLAVWTEFQSRSADAAPARLAAATSSDGGRSWSPRFVLQENTGRENVMSVSLCPLPSGELLLFHLEKNSPSDCRVVVRRSADEGRSFGPATRVTGDPGYHVLNNARVLRLRSGRLLVPVATTARVGVRPEDFRASVLWSDDDGRTWRRGADRLGAPGRGAMEPGLVELRDGRVLQLLRTQTGRIWRAFSADEGQTWTAAAAWDVASPESPATLAATPESGDLLLVWNPRVEWADAARTVPVAGHGGPRSPLAAMVSRDGGASWSVPRMLEDDPALTHAYTSVRFHAGRALLTYYEAPAGGQRFALRFRSVPLEALGARP